MDSEQKEEKKISRSITSLIDDSRVMGFSDSVFAFAATLLVLKIDLPAVVGDQLATQLPQAFATLWPQYLANIISFLVIGFYWLNHHAIFGLVPKYNSTIVWLNIILLIFISFLPFPVDLYGDRPSDPVVIAFYSISLALVGFMLLVMWLYASGKSTLIDERTSQKQKRYYTAQFSVAPIVFGLSAIVAFIDPIISQFSWIFVIVGILLANKIYGFKGSNEIEKESTA